MVELQEIPVSDAATAFVTESPDGETISTAVKDTVAATKLLLALQPNLEFQVFHLFPFLPTELRFMIWKLASYRPAQYIEVVEIADEILLLKTLSENFRGPAPYYVSKDARQAVLEIYTIMRSSANFVDSDQDDLEKEDVEQEEELSAVFVDFKQDVIVLGQDIGLSSLHSRVCDATGQLWGIKIENFAVYHEAFEGIGGHEKTFGVFMEKMRDYLSAFTSLKNLFFVQDLRHSPYLDTPVVTPAWTRKYLLLEQAPLEHARTELDNYITGIVSYPEDYSFRSNASATLTHELDDSVRATLMAPFPVRLPADWCYGDLSFNIVGWNSGIDPVMDTIYRDHARKWFSMKESGYEKGKEPAVQNAVLVPTKWAWESCIEGIRAGILQDGEHDYTVRDWGGFGTSGPAEK